jgi:hypothetical protein
VDLKACRDWLHSFLEATSVESAFWIQLGMVDTSIWIHMECFFFAFGRAFGIMGIS